MSSLDAPSPDSRERDRRWVLGVFASLLASAAVGSAGSAEAQTTIPEGSRDLNDFIFEGEVSVEKLQSEMQRVFDILKKSFESADPSALSEGRSTVTNDSSRVLRMGENPETALRVVELEAGKSYAFTLRPKLLDQALELSLYLSDGTAVRGGDTLAYYSMKLGISNHILDVFVTKDGKVQARINPDRLAAPVISSDDLLPRRDSEGLRIMRDIPGSDLGTRALYNFLSHMRPFQ